jgi:Spy/CpxP family protein refolding chaperone
MMRRTAWLLTVTLAVFVGSYVATRCWVGRHERNDLERLQDVSHLARVLALRPEQVQAIRELQERLCTSLAVTCSRHCACRGELAALLTAEAFDPARARKVQEAMCQAYANSEMAALEHIRRIRSLLDERQRAVFDGMLKRNFQQSCDTCARGGCQCVATGAPKPRGPDAPQATEKE